METGTTTIDFFGSLELEIEFEINPEQKVNHGADIGTEVILESKTAIRYSVEGIDITDIIEQMDKKLNGKVSQEINDWLN